MENNFKRKTAFLRKNPNYIKHTLDVINILFETFSIDIAKNEVINAITSDSQEDLERMYKNYLKSRKKQEAKFKYVNSDGKHIKKPPSGFQLWLKEKFVPSLTPEQKKVYIKQKIASTGWKVVSLEEKKIWDSKALVLKEEYLKNKQQAYEDAIYNGTFKEPKPKKPSSGYLIYCNSDEFKEHIRDMNFDSFGEQRKYSGSKWGTMSDVEKKPFIDIYEQYVIKYKIEMDDYYKRQIEREERLKTEAETK